MDSTGEEISENYGLMYTIKSRESRRRVLLSHYKFACVCIACTENWPTLQQMKAEVSTDKVTILAKGPNRSPTL